MMLGIVFGRRRLVPRGARPLRWYSLTGVAATEGARDPHGAGERAVGDFPARPARRADALIAGFGFGLVGHGCPQGGRDAALRGQRDGSRSTRGRERRACPRWPSCVPGAGAARGADRSAGGADRLNGSGRFSWTRGVPCLSNWTPHQRRARAPTASRCARGVVCRRPHAKRKLDQDTRSSHQRRERGGLYLNLILESGDHARRQQPRRRWPSSMSTTTDSKCVEYMPRTCFRR